jgi:hypothetical protein
MNEKAQQEWLDWAQRNRLGNDAQLRAAAAAAVEAASRGASSEVAAGAARAAAASIAGPSTGQPDRNLPLHPPQPGLVVGGITWEMAMNNAGRILAGLPIEGKDMLKAFPGANQPEYVNARVSTAQGWIAFARELTMHGRGTR